MLIDYFLYNGEIELLQLRYNYSKDSVAIFVVAEANYTFTGVPKEYTLEKDLKKCNIPIDQFLILKIDLSLEKLVILEQDIQRAKLIGSDSIDVIRFFARQRIQRNSLVDILNTDEQYITRGLPFHPFKNLSHILYSPEKFEYPTVFFLISDIDEFLNFDKLAIISNVVLENKTYCLKIPLIFLENSADKRLVDKDSNPIIYDDKLVLCTILQLIKSNPTDLRNNFTTSFSPIRISVNEKLDKNFGWLLHNMGSYDNKKKKYQSSISSMNVNVDYIFSNESKILYENILPKSKVKETQYKTIDYNLDDIIYEIFHLPEVKKYLLPNHNPIKIVDFVLYKDEEDLFRLRYKLLHKKIDLFVMVQGSTNFDGTYDNYKLLNKSNLIEFCNKHNFDLKKVRAISYKFDSDFDIISMESGRPEGKPVSKKVFDLLDNNDKRKPFSQSNTLTKINYVREKLLRNQLNIISEQFDENTIFFSGDIDEIINPKYVDLVIEQLLTQSEKICKIPLVFCEFRTDRRLVSNDSKNVEWNKGMFACTKTPLAQNLATHIRDEFNLKSHIFYIKQDENVLEDMGWHLSWVNNDAYNRTKAITNNYYNSINSNYPISIVGVNYLESLLGSKITHKNLISKTTYYPDEEFIKLIADDTPLCEFFLKDKSTYEQKLSYYKAKYNYIIQNQHNLQKTYHTIFSYLPLCETVLDYSANLGLALKEAFKLWGCQIKGFEYEKLHTQSQEFVGLYENLNFDLAPFYNKIFKKKSPKDINHLNYIPVKLIDNILDWELPIDFVKFTEGAKEGVDKTFCLGLAFDIIHYLPKDSVDYIFKNAFKQANMLLFSSANPKQYEFTYINCQWQSYWIEEFKNIGFKCFEIRDRLIDLDFVPNNYKTNLLLFSKRDLHNFVEVTNPNLYFDNDKILEHKDQS